MSNAPELVRDAVERYKREGLRGTDWVWMWANQTARDSVDEWLVEIEHPLAYQAGTQESRFRAIVEELARGG